MRTAPNYRSMLYWQSRLEQARRNRRGAEALRKAQEYGLACFSCQQAAEMALKAALESRALERAGHNLLDLIRQLEAASVTVPAMSKVPCAD